MGRAGFNSWKTGIKDTLEENAVQEKGTVPSNMSFISWLSSISCVSGPVTQTQTCTLNTHCSLVQEDTTVNKSKQAQKSNRLTEPAQTLVPVLQNAIGIQNPLF